ncbi:MAG: hypothetical protein IT430_19480 [Phycisphaerales bacterium]|nr:hypothetical protein [Phycisphaerales bacterium]
MDSAPRRSSVANGINSFGAVVGYFIDEQTYMRASLWREGILSDLDPQAPCCSNFAAAINDNGDIVGQRSEEGAVLWLANGQRIQLGSLGGRWLAQPYDINNNRQVVGESSAPPDDYPHPFIWQDGVMRDLGTFGGPRGTAHAINDSGSVVGTAEIPGTDNRPFLWEGGDLIQLDMLPEGNNGVATDINDAGLIVGGLEAESHFWYAVKWVDQQLVVIHDESMAWQSSASAVNNHGVIVGSMTLDSDAIVGYVMEDEHMVDLNSLIPPAARREIGSAVDINDYGAIIGLTKGDPARGVILHPVTTSFTLEPPVPGSAGVENVLIANGVTPGARVVFVASRFGGGTVIPGCGVASGAILQLDKPMIVGLAVANQWGIASISRTVPQSTEDVRIVFQAAIPSECKISQVLSHQFY